MTQEEEWYKQAEAKIARGREAREGILEEIRNAKAIIIPNEEKRVRPPTGLTPRYLVDEVRLEAIEAAMERFRVANYAIPREWYEERKEILDRWSDEVVFTTPALTEEELDAAVVALAREEETFELLEPGEAEPVAKVEYYRFGTPIATEAHVTKSELFELEVLEEQGDIRITKFEGIPAVEGKNLMHEKNI